MNTATKRPTIIEDEIFLGKPLSERPKTTRIKNGDQTVEVMVLPKENIGIGKYQRPRNENRVEKLHDVFHPDFGVVNVAETLVRGKYYYTLPDGQHRAKAQPLDSVVCIVTNSLPEAELFLMANNPEHVKPTTDDEYFWAAYYAGRSDCVYIYDYLVNEWGITPTRAIQENIREKEFCCAATLYAVFKQLRRHVVKRLNLTDSDENGVLNEVKPLFEHIVSVMFESYGTESFYPQKSNNYRGYPSVWKAMLRWLTVKGWPTKDLVVAALKDGFYSKNGRGQASASRITTLKDLVATSATDYIGGQTERAYQVIDSIYKHGTR